MFVWRKDQIDLTKLMGLKLWHPEWDLCIYLVRIQTLKLDQNDEVAPGPLWQENLVCACKRSR
jgi:hypothetical protein